MDCDTPTFKHTSSLVKENRMSTCCIGVVLKSFHTSGNQKLTCDNTDDLLVYSLSSPAKVYDCVSKFLFMYRLIIKLQLINQDSSLVIMPNVNLKRKKMGKKSILCFNILFCPVMLILVHVFLKEII